MRVVAVVAASLVLGLGGCATLDRGTADTLYVLSDPPGAQATTSAGSTCVTPCTLDVNRRDEFTVTITKAGFETRTVEVKTRLSGSGVGSFMENVVTGGAGMVVDAATGAAARARSRPGRRHAEADRRAAAGDAWAAPGQRVLTRWRSVVGNSGPVPAPWRLRALGLGGCATIENGTTDEIYVLSQPPRSARQPILQRGLLRHALQDRRAPQGRIFGVARQGWL